MSGLPLFFMVKVIDTDFNMLSITKREHCDLKKSVQRHKHK